MRGTVEWFNNEMGYGFIIAEEKSYFAHYSKVRAKGYKALKEGQVVEFKPVEVEGKLQAHEIFVVKQ